MEVVVVREQVCVLEDSMEIDFEYEFDADKYYDFTRDETDDEIRDAQLWFLCSSGYPPSPLIEKLDQETEDLEDDESDSDYVEEGGDDSAAFDGHGKKGQHIPNTKSKCTNQPLLPKSSRLLKPTASQLAKQSQQSAVNPGRPQKASAEITDTKRQKLDIGYLRKIEASDAKSPTKTKARIPREPELATARRAHIHRSKSEAVPCNNSKVNCSNNNASLQEKSDRVSTNKALQSNKKISSNKGDSGAFRNNKQESLVSRDSKLTSSKKHPQNLPVELFKKLSPNCMDQHNPLPEHKHSSLITRGFTHHLSSVMKENKIPDVIPEQPERCFMEHNQSIGGGLSYISKAIQPVPGA